MLSLFLWRPPNRPLGEGLIGFFSFLFRILLFLLLSLFVRLFLGNKRLTDRALGHIQAKTASTIISHCGLFTVQISMIFVQVFKLILPQFTFSDSFYSRALESFPFTFFLSCISNYLFDCPWQSLNILKPSHRAQKLGQQGEERNFKLSGAAHQIVGDNIMPIHTLQVG